VPTMGLSFHKSIKIGKNTRLNFSKNGGIGISTGVKGARVSVNKQGVRTSVGKNGVYYRKQASWNSLEGKSRSANNLPPLTDDEIRSDPGILKKYNSQMFNSTGMKLFKWYAIIAILAFILDVLVGSVGFWIIFILDCIGFVCLMISNIKYLVQFNKQGKMLYKDK
jgi:hypothetical protein